MEKSSLKVDIFLGVLECEHYVRLQITKSPLM